MGVGDTDAIRVRPTRAVDRLLGDGSILHEGIRYPVVFAKAGHAEGRLKAYEDASFEVGDSPATHVPNTDLGQPATDGYIVCDGDGNILIEISDDGTNYGTQLTLKKDEIFDLAGIKTHTIKITHSGTDSAYRIVVI